MQAMQDKEFDQLFKDRFEGAEIQPSSNLWGNIEKELAPKKTRKFPVYWAAAAVVVVATTVGLLSQKTEKLQLKGTSSVSTIEVAKTPEVTAVGTVVTEQITADPEGTPLVLAPKVKLENLVLKNKQTAMQPNRELKRQQINTPDVAPVVKEQIKPVVVPPVDIVIAKVDPPEVEKQDNEITETEGRERRGIRNVGDVINFVVDKLDKREKKIIQFRTDDDDNSSLIAVNIGILQFNPKRNK